MIKLYRLRGRLQRRWLFYSALFHWCANDCLFHILHSEKWSSCYKHAIFWWSKCTVGLSVHHICKDPLLYWMRYSENICRVNNEQKVPMWFREVDSSFVRTVCASWFAFHIFVRLLRFGESACVIKRKLEWKPPQPFLLFLFSCHGTIQKHCKTNNCR